MIPTKIWLTFHIWHGCQKMLNFISKHLRALTLLNRNHIYVSNVSDWNHFKSWKLEYNNRNIKLKSVLFNNVYIPNETLIIELGYRQNNTILWLTSLSERLSCVHTGLIISSQIRTGGLMSSELLWATEILKYWYGIPGAVQWAGQWLTCETLSLTKLLHWRLMNIRGSNTGMLPISLFKVNRQFSLQQFYLMQCNVMGNITIKIV